MWIKRFIPLSINTLLVNSAHCNIIIKREYQYLVCYGFKLDLFTFK